MGRLWGGTLNTYTFLVHVSRTSAITRLESRRTDRTESDTVKPEYAHRGGSWINVPTPHRTEGQTSLGLSCTAACWGEHQREPHRYASNLASVTRYIYIY